MQTFDDLLKFGRPLQQQEKQLQCPVANIRNWDDLIESAQPFLKQQAEGLQKSADMPLRKYLPLTKVEDTPGSPDRADVYGIVTTGEVDSQGESAEWDGMVDAIEQFRNGSLARSAAAAIPSLGNVRLMHSTEIAGAMRGWEFRRNAGQIWGKAELIGRAADMARNGMITGYSIGGSYKYRKCAECRQDVPSGGGGRWCANCGKTVVVKYAPKDIIEVSVVDSPANKQARFEYVKVGGASEFRKFAQGGNVDNSKAIREHCAKLVNSHKKLAGHFAKLQKSLASRGDNDSAGICGQISDEFSGTGQTFDSFGQLISPPDGIGLPGTPGFPDPSGGNGLGGYKNAADAAIAADFHRKLNEQLNRKMAHDAIENAARSRRGVAEVFKD